MLVSTPDSEPTVRGFEANRRVFGRFILARRLGAGGMGEVWLARDESLGVEVCLKFLPEHVRWSPGALSRHKAEALRARTLTHPNIVRVHDFVEDGTLAAIVMEYVEGRTLAAERLTRPCGVLTPHEITSWLPQLADALHYLHNEARVAHGDLKPTNMLIRSDGVLKLADFGVARDLVANDARAASTAGGTLPYLSPQRVLGAAVVPADDVYALGAVLYEMLTNRPPFYEGDLAAQIELLPPDSLVGRRRHLGIKHAAEIPPTWERYVQACLAKRAEDRPTALRAMVADLTTAKPRLTRRRMILAAGTACIAVVVGGGVWWRAREIALTPRQPVIRAATEFSESFNSGLAGWVRWGDPASRLLSAYQGREWVFDNNGDGIHHSGVTSIVTIAARDGFELRSDVRLDVTNPTGCHLGAYIGLTYNPSDWMNALGSKGDSGAGVSMSIDYAGDTCWGADPAYWRHAYFGAWFIADDGKRVDIGEHLPREQWTADSVLNRWTTLRIEVSANREVRFFDNEKLLWAPSQRLHPRVLAGQRLVVHGRSAGLAGKAYHDNVVLRAPAGANLKLATANNVVAAREESFAWDDSAWTQRVTNGATRVPWPAKGDELHLAATGGGVVGVRTRRGVADFSAAEFDVQPFLNSGGVHPDVLTVFVEHRESGAWRRWAVEMRASEIWLVERDNTGADTVVSRAGTYAPGAWTTLVFSRDATGVMEVVGSRLQPTRFAHKLSGSGEWALGYEVSASTDGATVRPPRVSVTPR